MRYIECRVVYIDTVRNVLDAVSFDGLNWFEDVTYVNTGLKKSGSLYHPEIGDVVVCNLVEDGQAEVIKFYSQRKTDSNNLVTNVVGKAEIGTELPGDRILSGPDGAILKLLRGGYAGIGASPLAQTMYLAIEGLVRTVAQNYEVISAGTRIYSLTVDGKVMTRMCFNTSEKFFTEGANKNDGAEAENFEYQIDIGEAGFVIFTGEIGANGKRTNNLTIRMKQNGDLQVVCGTKIVFDIHALGSIALKLTNNDNVPVYTKTITTTGKKCVVNERIDGDVVRNVTGNVVDNIVGQYSVNGANINMSATIINNSSTMMRNSTSINVNEIEKPPTSGMSVK